MEVLVKKASVDPWFKALLLERRAGAAAIIGLELDPAETALLTFIPPAQLEAVIARTKVEPSKVPAFLGKAAAVMLVALGATGASAQVLANGQDSGKPAVIAPSNPDNLQVAQAGPPQHPNFPINAPGIRPPPFGDPQVYGLASRSTEAPTLKTCWTPRKSSWTWASP